MPQKTWVTLTLTFNFFDDAPKWIELKATLLFSPHHRVATNALNHYYMINDTLAMYATHNNKTNAIIKQTITATCTLYSVNVLIDIQVFTFLKG